VELLKGGVVSLEGCECSAGIDCSETDVGDPCERTVRCMLTREKVIKRQIVMAKVYQKYVCNLKKKESRTHKKPHSYM